MKPKNIKTLQARSRRLITRRVDEHTLVVQSATNPVANHIVTVNFGPGNTVHTRCTCAWAVNRGVGCMHVMAALEYLASLKRRTLSFWPDKESALRQKNRVFHISGAEGLTSPDSGIWVTSRTG